MSPSRNPTPLAGIRATLAASRVFDGLPAADLGRIAGFSRLVRLDRDASLFREGDASRGFFVVQSGVILVHRSDAQGREQVLHQLEPGDSFAEASMTAPGGYPADAKAITPACVVHIPKDAFIADLARNPELALRIIASLSRHIRGLADRMRTLHTQDADARLAAHLLALSDAARCAEFTLPTTRRVLAANLGMAEETLSRAFARLKTGGLVIAQARRIRIRDRAALANAARA